MKPQLLSAHPIDDNIRARVQQALDQQVGWVREATHQLIDEINRLLAIKISAGEAEYSPRWPAIHAFIEAELEGAERNPDYKRPQGDASELDRFLMEVVMA